MHFEYIEPAMDTIEKANKYESYNRVQIALPLRHLLSTKFCTEGTSRQTDISTEFAKIHIHSTFSFRIAGPSLTV